MPDLVEHEPGDDQRLTPHHDHGFARDRRPARGPRAQCDRVLYAEAAQRLLASQPKLRIVEGSVERIEVREVANGSRCEVKGVTLAGGAFIACDCAIVTTGTFLRGLLHTGEEQTRGGRMGEASAEGLSACLRDLGFELGRLKTGTTPRLNGRTINFKGLEPQPGDKNPKPFSFTTTSIPLPQVPCHITYTNEETHAAIRWGLDRSPLYSGIIKVIIDLHKKLDKKGGCLCILETQKTLYDVLDVIGLTKILRIYKSEKDFLLDIGV